MIEDYWGLAGFVRFGLPRVCQGWLGLSALLDFWSGAFRAFVGLVGFRVSRVSRVQGFKGSRVQGLGFRFRV